MNTTLYNVQHDVGALTNNVMKAHMQVKGLQDNMAEIRQYIAIQEHKKLQTTTGR